MDGRGPDSSGSEQRQVAGFCEHGNESSVTQNVGNLLTNGRTGRHLYIQTLKTSQQRFRTGRTQNVFAINLQHNAQSRLSKHSRNQKTRTALPTHHTAQIF